MSENRWVADLAEFGPFFAVDVHDAADVPTESWRPMTSLLSDSDALPSRIDRVRAALAQRAGSDVADAVAVSVAHLGLTARLIAPAIGAAALGIQLAWDIESLWWKDELGGPYPLSIAPKRTNGQESTSSSHHFVEFDTAAEAITLALIDRYPVSPRVLWGNIGSATNSAAQMISRARPDLAGIAHNVANTILTDHRIDGGALIAGPRFRRQSCCLIYRIGSGSENYCGDCILRS